MSYWDGYQVGEHVIRKCGLSQEDARDVRRHKHAWRYIPDNLTEKKEFEWIRGFEDGTDAAIRNLNDAAG